MLPDAGDGHPVGVCAPLRRTDRNLGPQATWDAAIVVPAKDEEKRITACLDAAGLAIARAGGLNVGLVLVVNNTTDATAARALDWAAEHARVAVTVIDCTFAASGAGVGAARRLGLDAACARLHPHGALLITDADTRVRADWVMRNLAELETADLICGTVLAHPDELHSLPAAIAAHGSAEQEYLMASIRLEARLDPLPHDPAPAHHSAGGASMAVPRRVYEAVGGMPPLQVCEDRAFAAGVEAHDYRLRFSASPVVETSCRMTGRTGGGMAGTLRARACETDPLADEWLEAAGTLAVRSRLRGRLRALWPNVRAMHTVLSAALGRRFADRALSTPPGPHFGAFFAALERQAPQLARRRMRQGDCRRELPGLLRFLAAFDTAPRRDPGALLVPRHHHARGCLT